MLEVLLPLLRLDVLNGDLVDGHFVGQERRVCRRLVVILTMQHIMKLNAL